MKLGKLSRLCAIICALVCLMCSATVFGAYLNRRKFGMIVLGLLVFGIFTVIWLLLKKFEGKLTKKRVRIIFAIFCGILLVEQILLVRYINYNYEMVDPKITGEFAKSFVMGDDLSKVKESYRIYAAKYPNAWGMIYLQIPFYAVWKLFTGGVSIYAGETLNIILIQLSAIMTFLTGEKIFASHSQQLFCGIITTTLPAMLLYTPFFHSDTAGMVFVSGALYFLTLAVKAKSLRKCIIFGLIASLFIAVGNTVKGSIALMLVAAVIFFILKIGVKRGLILSLAAVMLFIGVSKCAYYGGIAMGISNKEMIDRYRFPVTHWIMMSLNEKDKTHVDEDVDFTMSFETYDEKKQANIREIKARLAKINTPQKLCKKVYHKIARTWSGGGFSYRKYISRSEPTGQLCAILKSWQLRFFVDGSHSAMLIGMALGALYAAGKHRRPTFFLCLVTLAGVIMFFLIWENPPRYIVTFIPVIMILCSTGNRYFCQLCKLITKRERKLCQEL